jgi:hypothetical protein
MASFAFSLPQLIFKEFSEKYHRGRYLREAAAVMYKHNPSSIRNGKEESPLFAAVACVATGRKEK